MKGGGLRSESQNSIKIWISTPKNTPNQIQKNKNKRGSESSRRIWPKFNQIPKSNGRIGARIRTSGARSAPGKNHPLSA